MRQVMLSLDKKIFDPESAVAQRMIEYGKTDQLYIIIPHSENKVVKLSDTVVVVGTGGGNKGVQWWKMYAIGAAYMQHTKVDYISSQDPFFLGWNGLGLAQKYKILFEAQVHGDFFSSDYYRRSGFMNWLRYHMGVVIVRRAGRVRVVGERIKQSLVKLGVPEQKIVLRPVPVSIPVRSSAGILQPLKEIFPGFEKIFLWYGRMEPVKNSAWLIEVFGEIKKNHPKWGLFLQGDGSEKARLIKKVAELKLENNVKFSQTWSKQMPLSYVKTATCVLFPSLCEGYGLVPMEAVAVGTPVIMTDVGVANYELKPSEKVRIVPVGDKETFIKEMLAI